MIRKSLIDKGRLKKKLHKFRDIDPKRIVAIVKRNPSLLLASEENVQIFMLATISRSNAKNVAKRRSMTHP